MSRDRMSLNVWLVVWPCRHNIVMLALQKLNKRAKADYEQSIFDVLLWCSDLDVAVLPTGAPKAAETPAAAPAETKSLFSVSLRKYSNIYKNTYTY